jgi:hypothetical protein
MMNKKVKTESTKEFNEVEEETLQGFILEQGNNFFVNHIPIDFIKELPGTCKHPPFFALR